MKIRILPALSLAVMALLLNTGCSVHKSASFTPKADLLQTIDKRLQEASKQYLFLAEKTPENRLPRSSDKNGKYVTSDSRWWCSGFYPGTLFYLYEATKDAQLQAEALEKLKVLEKEQFNKSTHDLGFMMYCSYGNANRLQPKPEYKDILVNSARSLSSRYNPQVKAIRSWNSKPNQFLVIIDNMMNLELLFWATKATGDSSFYDIAVTHANTTMQHHFRPDYSSYHLVDYNSETGEPQVKKTVQGAADESAWARGQAWGLYGYTVMYRETKDKKYLEQANHIADFLLNHPNLPKDKIPYWDFNAPGIPNALRDVSAGAVISSALLELAGYNDQATGKRYLDTAEEILTSLSSPTYFAAYGENNGFLLKHSVGSLPHKLEVDAPLTYADYYYVEAMMRYRGLGKK